MNRVKQLYRTVSNVAQNPSMCPELDLKTRIIGFIVCFIIGIFMLISSISQLLTLALGGQRWFAIWYTAGNTVCLASSFFFMGPKRQCENMLKPERRKISLILFISMLSCVFLALAGFSKLIILLDIGVQFCALTWYVLSYIPNGQLCCKNLLKGFISGKKESFGGSGGSYSEMV